MIPEGFTEEEWEGLSDTEKEGIASTGAGGEDIEEVKYEDLVAIAEGAEAPVAEVKTAEATTEVKPESEVKPIVTEEVVAELKTEDSPGMTDEQLLSYQISIDESKLPKMGDEVIPPVLQEKLNEVQTKFDAGDIPLAEYTKSREDINRQISRENYQAYQDTVNQSRTALTFRAEQDIFFGARKEYREETPRGNMMFAALDNAIMSLMKDPKNAGMSRMALMIKGDQLVRETFGISKSVAGKPDVKAVDRKPAAQIPTDKTLADIPAAESNSTTDWMQAGDKLIGEPFEKWLDSLTESQRDAYMSKASS